MGFLGPTGHELVELDGVQLVGVDAIVFEGLLVEVGDAVLSERIAITVESGSLEVQPVGL